MRNIKGIVFDVDGVLINTEEVHFKAYRDVLHTHGFNLDQSGYKKWFSGKSIEGGVTAFAKDNKLKLDAELIKKQKIAATVQVFHGELDFYQDTLEFINRIAGETIILPERDLVLANPTFALATGLVSLLVEEILAQQPNLAEIFTVIIAAEDYTHSKPDPECYLKAATAMRLEPEYIVGVEDSPAGVEALNKAGIYSVAITNTHTVSELSEAKIVTGSLVTLLQNSQIGSGK